MEANNSTRTYTTPTCSLTVDRSPVLGTSRRGKFTLSVEDPDRDSVERVTVSGDVDRLGYLRQIVNRYIAELVAKFPLPKTAISEAAPIVEPTPPPATPAPPQPSQPDFSDIDSPRSGFIKKNLPGLRKMSQANSPADAPLDPSAQGDLDKLFGRDRQPADNAAAPLESDAWAQQSRPAIDPADSPYFAEADERALEHHLHVGNLETTAVDRVLPLSAIQLFDLATVLDEHSRDTAQGSQTANASIFSREALGERLESDTTAATANSKLPTLPRTAGANEINEVYARNQRKPQQSSSLLSILPWAAGTAFLVGSGLLFFDNNSNPVKEFVSNLNIPGLTGTTKTRTAKAKPPTTATTPTATDTIATNPSAAPTPTVSTPGQWQTQPVTPPAVKTTPTTAAGTTNIGTAPLPNAIAPAASQLPTALDGSTPNTTATSAAANQILAGGTGTASTKPTVLVTATAPSTPTAVAAKQRIKPANSKATTIGQLPIDNPTTGKVSVSRQPISIPASPVPPIDLTPATPIPFNPPNMGDTTAASPSPKPAKPKTAAKPKPAASKAPEFTPNPQQTAEPFTPVPRNPNLIVPESSGNDATAANPAVGGAEPTANVALNESKRYFQGKWKADATQPSALQYVIQVSGKSGIVRSVEPQGEAASAALQKSKFVKLGQKLLSPAAAGSADRKIRVLLQPDGSVETYTEP